MHPSLGPTSYPAQQQRNLSPITELTTPASLRSITFSLLADHDYRSEREGEDIPSPRSFESAQTILAAFLEPARSLSPVCSPTSPASQPPLIPLGSPVRTLRETDPSTTTQYLTTPPSTALIPDGPAFALRSSSLPTGVPILPSALRDSDTAPEAEDKRPVQRRTPSFIVDEAKSDRPELRMSTDWSEEEDAKSTAGLAGIGAGVASGPENAWMKRLSSVQEDQQAPNKERPKTFHGIGTEHVFDAVEGDFPLGMEPLDRIQMRVSLLQLVGRVLMPSQQGQAAAGSGQATSTLHFLLAACQSLPSLDKGIYHVLNHRLATDTFNASPEDSPTNADVPLLPRDRSIQRQSRRKGCSPSIETSPSTSVSLLHGNHLEDDSYHAFSATKG